MPKVPAFFRHAGVKLNSIALEFTRSGPAAATINAIAQGETRFGTSQGGTPTSLTFSRISQFQGSIKRAGSPVGNLTGGSVTYSKVSSTPRSPSSSSPMSPPGMPRSRPRHTAGPSTSRRPAPPRPAGR
jgi:Phage tail tube protein